MCSNSLYRRHEKESQSVGRSENVLKNGNENIKLKISEKEKELPQFKRKEGVLLQTSFNKQNESFQDKDSPRIKIHQVTAPKLL
mmetsp:Transcript_27957/g.36131  ORF Transcript_27957/g.36131 Transcript_27957/m.36131 type:complete len:84 (+) Transcript_27957:2225-2476(+)